MRYVRFYGNNGYCGTDYEEYVAFEDDVTIQELDEYSHDLCYENAETFEYMVTGWGESWESAEDEEEYYENALEYGGWEFVTRVEYEENTQN